MTLVRSDQKSDTDVREKQFKVLQETIRNLQTQLLENKAKEKEFNMKISDLEVKLKQANVKELLLKTKIANNRNSSSSSICSLPKPFSELLPDEYEKNQLIMMASNNSLLVNNNNTNLDMQHNNHQNDESNNKILDTNDAGNQTYNTQVCANA